jgi:DNA-binding transcriptional ArsR family regulator
VTAIRGELSTDEAVRVSQLGKALNHPTRALIAAALVRLPQSSPAQLSIAFHIPLGSVSYHVRQLIQAGFLLATDTRPRRGAIEHFYALHPSLQTALLALAEALGAAGDELPVTDLTMRQAIRVGELGKALSHPVRARVAFHLLHHGESSGTELATRFDEPLSMVAYHVKHLYENRFITRSRLEVKPSAQQAFYVLEPTFAGVLEAIC